MRVLIAAGGTWKAGPERMLFDAYLSHLPWKTELLEIAAQTPQAEGEKMLAAIKRFQPHHTIALDERGKNLGSREFAGQLSRWMDAGENKLAVLIGGHAGLDKQVRAQVDLMLSFGQMTWPHLLARALLAEQLYRAQSIIVGHPYHRD